MEKALSEIKRYHPRLYEARGSSQRPCDILLDDIASHTVEGESVNDRRYRSYQFVKNREKGRRELNSDQKIACKKLKLFIAEGFRYKDDDSFTFNKNSSHAVSHEEARRPGRSRH